MDEPLAHFAKHNFVHLKTAPQLVAEEGQEGQCRAAVLGMYTELNSLQLGGSCDKH